MIKQKINKLIIIALAAHGRGISGGDRIFIELSRRWSRKVSIDIYLDQEGYEMCKRQNLKAHKKLHYKVLNLGWLGKLGFVGNYASRIINGLKLGLTLNLEREQNIYIYNASEFWMDSFTCALIKLRYSRIKWVASWYQTAPNPFIGYSENLDNRKRNNNYNFSALLYWLVQIPVKPLVIKFADKVIVNNESEINRFPKHRKDGNTIVLIGAVPLDDIQKWKKTNSKLSKNYDAVFQGRFHPQKGVVELIEIWMNVVKKIPSAKLAMIGDGPLRQDVEFKIREYNLEDNIKLFGFVFDGPEKYTIFSRSKIVVHPAFYDSGGMASAEAMAFGLPCIGFDLEAYKSYYPKGMLKVKNEKEFANAIVKLLMNSKLRDKLGSEALELIKNSYSWDSRSEEIFRKI